MPASTVANKCPRCFSEAERLQMSGNGSGLLVFLLGGWLAYLVHADSQKNQCLCKHCGLVFKPSSAISQDKLLRTGFVFVAIVFLIAVVFAFHNYWP